jgi:hypothetical protein
MPGEQDDKSRVTGDCYARICGSPGVRFPWATRLAVPPVQRSGAGADSRVASRCAMVLPQVGSGVARDNRPLSMVASNFVGFSAIATGTP